MYFTLNDCALLFASPIVTVTECSLTLAQCAAEPRLLAPVHTLAAGIPCVYNAMRYLVS
jgi:hypothetical protein